MASRPVVLLMAADGPHRDRRDLLRRPQVRILGGGEHPLDLPSTFPLHGTLMPELADSDCFAKGPTMIGNDVWIRTHSTVLGSMHIADGALVGASAVVTRDVDPYTIVTGESSETCRAALRQPVD